MKNSLNFTKEQISEIIEKAWCDKTTFDDIKATYNLNENHIKKLLKKNLKKKAIFCGEKELLK